MTDRCRPIFGVSIGCRAVGSLMIQRRAHRVHSDVCVCFFLCVYVWGSFVVQLQGFND